MLQWHSIADFLQFWLRENPLTGAERQVFETYYGSYVRQFSSYVRHHFAGQTREISELIRAAGHPRLLEIGAGCGTEALWFALQGADVTALDVTTERLAVATARKQWLQHRLGRELSAKFQEMSVFDYEAETPFDLMWMEQTFHHLEPREKLFGKLFNLLKPGGSLVICEINAWNLLLQLQFFRQRGFKTKSTFLDSKGNRVEYGNERVTTSAALARGLRSAGFVVSSIRPFRLLPNSAPPERWLRTEEKIVELLPALSTHYILVAKREH
jgi:2-polyprenyl-3-methyl-5-hydroxy-6-metoxy-1,4-benzoquinol methylase